MQIGGETITYCQVGAGLEPLHLEAKEGLALINGTQAMSSLLALAVLEIRRLVKIADLVGAMTTHPTLRSVSRRARTNPARIGC